MDLEHIEYGIFNSWVEKNNIIFVSVERDRSTGVNGFRGWSELKKQAINIFENDICRWHTTENGCDKIWPIEYDNDKGCFCMGGMPLFSIFESGFYQPPRGESNIEVLGDIHMNPELWKEIDEV